MPPVFGPVVAVVEPLEVARRARAAAPARRRTARAATPRARPSAPRPRPAPRPSRTGRSTRHARAAAVGLGHRRAHHHALTGGEAVGLDHDLAVGLGDRGLDGRHRVAHRVARGRRCRRRPSAAWRRPSSPRARRPPSPARRRGCRRPGAGRRGRATSGTSGPITTRSAASRCASAVRPSRSVTATSCSVGDAARCRGSRARRAAPPARATSSASTPARARAPQIQPARHASRRPECIESGRDPGYSANAHHEPPHPKDLLRQRLIGEIAVSPDGPTGRLRRAHRRRRRRPPPASGSSPTAAAAPGG